MKLLSASALLISIGRASSTCNLTPCDAGGDYCLGSSSDLLDCLNTVPYNASWATATLTTLKESLTAGYGFLQFMEDTGPPYRIEVDLLSELDDISAALPYSNQFGFEEAVQSTLIKTLDAHTRYSKPLCFNGTFASPLIFQLEASNEVTKGGSSVESVKAILAKSAHFDEYVTMYPASADIASSLVGQELILVNNKEWQTEVYGWSSHDAR